MVSNYTISGIKNKITKDEILFIYSFQCRKEDVVNFLLLSSSKVHQNSNIYHSYFCSSYQPERLGLNPKELRLRQ